MELVDAAQLSPEQIAQPYIDATYPNSPDTPFCDVVMKGGVTSGVVYPLAICRIAQRYLFRNIGGTSAGAIAAALGAAAEYSRRAGGDGFKQLAALPIFLAKNNGLLNLFQPSMATKPLFDALLAATQNQPIPAIVFRAFRSYWPWSVGLVLLTEALAFPIQRSLVNSPAAFAWALLLTVPFAGLAATLGVLFGLWRTIRTRVPENYFGMCTGISQQRGKPLPLTTWLYQEINAYANLPGPAPLTFGDLWGAKAPWLPGGVMSECTTTGNDYLDDLKNRSCRSINLEMVTTNVTIGRPYRLPFSPLNLYTYYFDQREMADLFPPQVVQHLIVTSKNAGLPQERYTDPETKQAVVLDPLPPPKDFPVVMAARMSLSFPLLFSAIPLYAVPKAGNPQQTPPQKCWFSDGGISSNLPIQFFDNPLPRWPTFALNLRNVVPGSAKRVAMADANASDINEVSESGGNRLPSFLAAILDAMQNWNDNILMQLSGYRERVVEIQLDATQGGLNLAMADTTIKTLMQDGAQAGDELIQQFFAPPPQAPTTRWEEQRVTRLRSTLVVFDEYARAVHDATSVAPYEQTIAGAMKPFPWASAAQARLGQRLLRVVAVTGGWLKLKPAPQDPMQAAPVPGPETKPRGRI